MQCSFKQICKNIEKFSMEGHIFLEGQGVPTSLTSPVETLQEHMSLIKFPGNDEIFQEVSKQLDVIFFGHGSSSQPRLQEWPQF